MSGAVRFGAGLARVAGSTFAGVEPENREDPMRGTASIIAAAILALVAGQVLANFADRPQAVQVAAKALPRFE